MVWGRVMLEFRSGEEIKPAFGVIGTKDAKICFYFLIGVFCLSVSLGVIGSGQFNVILKEPG